MLSACSAKVKSHVIPAVLAVCLLLFQQILIVCGRAKFSYPNPLERDLECRLTRQIVMTSIGKARWLCKAEN